MFLGRKNQYFENDYITKCNQQIECNPYQIPKAFFTELEQNISQIISFSLVAQSCLTLCDPMNCSTPSHPVHHQLPEFIETHVHRVSDTYHMPNIHTDIKADIIRDLIASL